MKHIDSAAISDWERFYRANFINSLSGFKPVSLIATVGEGGTTNLAVFSNIVHIGADPALVGFVNRPREAAPHTLRNIEARGFYTINHVRAEFSAAAHQTSAKYPDGVSEFAEVGLHEDWIEGFQAPFVRESAVRFGVELSSVIPIPMNGTFFVIGQIRSVSIDASLIREDGFIDLHAAGSMVSVGLDGYSTVGRPVRYRYAKPNKPVERLD